MTMTLSWPNTGVMVLPEGIPPDDPDYDYQVVYTWIWYKDEKQWHRY